MLGLYDRLFPEDNPKSNRRWRTSVGISIMTLSGLGTLVFCGLVTGLPLVGKVAWAGDVDKKVSAAVKPLEDRMTKVEAAVNDTTSTTKILLSKLASDQVDALVRRRCKSADPDEISYLSKEIRKYQEDYENARGRVYPTPTCEEVGYKEKVR
jgi:hypothetical protein